MERILTESKSSKCLLTIEDLIRASKVFKNILLKCRHWVSFIKNHLNELHFSYLKGIIPFRACHTTSCQKTELSQTFILLPEKHVFLHQGAVEGCCVGFTKFCACLLSNNDPQFRNIPAHMLTQVSCGHVYFSCRRYLSARLQIFFFSDL